MIGSSIAFYYQHPEHLRRDRTLLQLGNREREALALQVGLLVGGAFHRGEPPLTRDELTRSTGTPREAVELVISDLCDRKILCETVDPHGLIPTRSLERISLAEMLDAIRGHNVAVDNNGMITDRITKQLSAEIDGAIAQKMGERTLYDLVETEVTRPSDGK